MLYISIGVLLFIGQRSLLYFPTEIIDHNFEEVGFSNEDEFINVIVLNKGKEKAILYFGGNAESVALSATDLVDLFASHTVYLMNYRGYGGSSGAPEERGIYSDALRFFDEIKPKHTEISVVGRSLGSGIATYLAVKRQLNKLVLITPFDSIQSVAQERFPFYPMSILLRDKYDSFSRAYHIRANTLVIMARNDDIIKNKHTNRLVKAFLPSQITVEIIDNVGHNNISEDARYYKLIQQFL